MASSRIFILCILWVLLTSCVDPPVFTPASDVVETPPQKAVMHALYLDKDPLHIFPDRAYWVVTEVDGKKRSNSIYDYKDPEHPVQLHKPAVLLLWSEVENRIPLEPGTHWFRMEADEALSTVFWISFEVQTEPGHQYLLWTPVGCDILRRKIVLKILVNLEIIEPNGKVRREKVEGLCTHSEKSNTCRTDKDCQDDLQCVVTSNTGYGMCGQPSKELLQN